MMRDCRGRMMCVGDFVVTTMNNYADLYFGQVKGFTAQKVRLEVKYHDGRMQTVTKFPSQVCRTMEECDA